MTETEKAIKAERLRIRKAIAQELRITIKYMKHCEKNNDYPLTAVFWDKANDLIAISKIIGK